MTVAPDLRELLALETRADVDDGYGNTGPFGDFAEVFRAWGRVKPLSGGETVTAGRLTGTQTFGITVRWSPQATSVTSAWRARNLTTGDTYDIKNAVADERREFVELLGEMTT